MFTLTCCSVIFITAAISLYDFPSTSRNCMQVRCFSGNRFIRPLTRSTLSRCITCSSGVLTLEGCVLTLSSSSNDTFWFSILFWWSSATLRHIVIQKASIDSICSHCSRRFQTFIIVSCTTSSASSLLRVIRSAMRKSSFFSGNTSVRKLISFILSKY